MKCGTLFIEIIRFIRCVPGFQLYLHMSEDTVQVCIIWLTIEVIHWGHGRMHKVKLLLFWRERKDFCTSQDTTCYNITHAWEIKSLKKVFWSKILFRRLRWRCNWNCAFGGISKLDLSRVIGGNRSFRKSSFQQGRCCLTIF